MGNARLPPQCGGDDGGQTTVLDSPLGLTVGPFPPHRGASIQTQQLFCHQLTVFPVSIQANEVLRFRLLKKNGGWCE